MYLKHKILASWKYCFSILKSDWGLEDYPVAITKLGLDPTYNGTPRKRLRYAASIIYWGLAGGGDSKEAALQALRRAFKTAKDERRAEGKPLPRPGTRVPAEFGSQERINAHSELTDDFIRRVLELEWAWISDESTLRDFNSQTTNDALIAKIEALYGVDVSDIESAKLHKILERIACAGTNVPGRYLN